MTKWVILFQGMNVGRSGRIRMDALKESLEQSGLRNVRTYIQSGNVIAESDDGEALVRMKASSAIQTLGLVLPVFVRRADGLRALLDSCPFSPERREEAARKNTEGESYYICFFDGVPATENVIFDEIPGEEIHFDGRHAFLLLEKSIRHAQLIRRLARLGLPYTIRNERTVLLLADCAEPSG